MQYQPKSIYRSEAPIAGASCTNLLQAIASVMAEVGPVEKRGTNSFFNYRYATAADILHQVQPLMGREGLIIFQNQLEVRFLNEGAVIAVDYEFTIAHKSGEVWPVKIRRTGLASARTNKGTFDDKGVNKCHTSAHKYFILALFEIPTGDYDDSDDEADPRRPNTQKKEYTKEEISAGILVEMQAGIRSQRSVSNLDRLQQSPNFNADRGLLTPDDEKKLEAEILAKREMLEDPTAGTDAPLPDKVEKGLQLPPLSQRARSAVQERPNQPRLLNNGPAQTGGKLPTNRHGLDDDIPF